MKTQQSGQAISICTRTPMYDTSHSLAQNMAVFVVCLLGSTATSWEQEEPQTFASLPILCKARMEPGRRHGKLQHTSTNTYDDMCTISTLLAMLEATPTFSNDLVET